MTAVSIGRASMPRARCGARDARKSRVFDVEIAGRPEEVRKEIASTAVFWRDRLAGQQLEAAFVHASDPWFETLSGEVQTLFGRAPLRVKAPANLVVAGIPAAIERSAAPALALLGAGY